MALRREWTRADDGTPEKAVPKPAVRLLIPLIKPSKTSQAQSWCRRIDNRASSTTKLTALLSGPYYIGQADTKASLR